MNAASLALQVLASAMPPHVAAGDEPIPHRTAPLAEDGPDMHSVMGIEDMLADLRHFDDDEVGYVERWRSHMASIGAWAVARYKPDGQPSLSLGMPCDEQIRHRNRWAHFLLLDLSSEEGRREVLLLMLLREGRIIDERPTNARATTIAVRGYLQTGGRILLSPEGYLTEAGGASRAQMQGTKGDRARAAQAVRAYFEVRRAYRSDRQIRRMVRLLGARTEYGWMVLGGAA